MTFVVDHMGTGLKGLILAAVLAATMSNLSSSFNSSASALMSDWLQRWLPDMDDRKSLRLARLLTLVSAVVHAAVAIVAYKMELDRCDRRHSCSASPDFRSACCWGCTAWADRSQNIAKQSRLPHFSSGRRLRATSRLEHLKQLVVHFGGKHARL